MQVLFPFVGAWAYEPINANSFDIILPLSLVIAHLIAIDKDEGDVDRLSS